MNCTVDDGKRQSIEPETFVSIREYSIVVGVREWPSGSHRMKGCCGAER